MATASEGANQSPYRNQPLRPGEIRLLTIEPANLQHVFPWLLLEFRIVTTRRKLEDKPEFDAISYVWGTAPASISIPCNDGSILITPTAHHMLGFLRLQKRPLWIDALCINQGDEVEKATQIPLMGQIYANASYEQKIWTGEVQIGLQKTMRSGWAHTTCCITNGSDDSGRSRRLFLRGRQCFLLKIAGFMHMIFLPLSARGRSHLEASCSSIP
jgi:hypothetical protein